MADLCHGQKVYWADGGTGKIQRANLDGSNVEDIVTSQPQPVGIAVDVAGGRIYWTDLDADQVFRAGLTGAGPGPIVTSGPVNPQEIAIAGGGRLLWTSGASPGDIQQANLNGSGSGSIGITGLFFPEGIAFSRKEQRIYWVDRAAKRIQRANADGTGKENVIVMDVSADPRHLAIDGSTGKIYWADSGTGSGTGRIRRANANGTDIEDVITGLQVPAGIAIDTAGGKVYWTDTLDNKIRRASLDGADVEEIVVSGLDTPLAIDLWLPLDCDADGIADGVDDCPCSPAPGGIDANGRPLGDCDSDCDLDLADFSCFQLNFSGPQPPS
jgi:DNA-binding beta-propeller fold protein YncE